MLSSTSAPDLSPSSLCSSASSPLALHHSINPFFVFFFRFFFIFRPFSSSESSISLSSDISHRPLLLSCISFSVYFFFSNSLNRCISFHSAFSFSIARASKIFARITAASSSALLRSFCNAFWSKFFPLHPSHFSVQRVLVRSTSVINASHRTASGTSQFLSTITSSFVSGSNIRAIGMSFGC